MNTETGKRYSFKIYPSALLTTVFDKATMQIPSMPASIAREFTDIDSQHAAYLPTLPQGTPVNTESLLFCYVQLPTGEKVVLAHNWIDESTLQEISGVTVIATIQDTSLETVELVRQIMASNGLQAVITTR